MTDIVEVARAIGAASPSKDLQFAAKHWERVDDPESKNALLKMALAGVKRAEETRVVALTHDLKIGQWFKHKNQDLIARLLAVSTPEDKACLEWWKVDGRYYTLSVWGMNEVQQLEKIEGEPVWTKS